jgi:uncharacterized protein (DUF1501 family)
MHSTDSPDPSRRAFLRHAGGVALTGAGLPLALNLAALGEAAAFNATDYKALVCVFLFGGNDYANTVVPYDEGRHARHGLERQPGDPAVGAVRHRAAAHAAAGR